jgi:hypothetical protein
LVNGDRVGGSAEREDRSVFGQIRHVVAEAARSESEKRAAKSREAEVIVQGIATPAAEDFRPEPVRLDFRACAPLSVAGYSAWHVVAFQSSAGGLHPPCLAGGAVKRRLVVERPLGGDRSAAQHVRKTTAANGSCDQGTALVVVCNCAELFIAGPAGCDPAPDLAFSSTDKTIA